MSYYLAIHEAPCVGVAPVTFEADTDAQAEVYAFEQSVTDPQFVIGGYDLYRIVYNPVMHKHELSVVVPEEEVAPCDEIPAPVHCNWCGWSGDEFDLDMNEHDEPTFCPVCGHSDCIADS